MPNVFLCITKESEDLTAQALKYRPEFKQWVDYYISSDDLPAPGPSSLTWIVSMDPCKILCQ
jgi:hypothetical protein